MIINYFLIMATASAINAAEAYDKRWSISNNFKNKQS